MAKGPCLFCFILCVFLLLSIAQPVLTNQISDNEFQGNQAEMIDSDWFLDPQIYNMGAFISEDIEKYHITVNGLWNGFIGDNISSPFAFGRLLDSAFSGITYDSDEAFVDRQHDLGMIVPATILTIQGHRSLQQDDFDTFASRSINGELCPWDIEADSYWMNICHPGFLQWCIDHGKKAIDAGADIIVLDEIQGNSLIPTFQWSSQYTGHPAPGFSDDTIDGFRSYLSETFSDEQLDELFSIDDIATVDLKNRIAQTMHLTYNERITVDSLIEAYQTFLDISNFHAKKQLILSLREYASQQDKEIVISANSYALGSNQPFDFWAKGLIFADVLDLFTFENTYTAVMDQTIPGFYQTKWLAWERLAYAATDAPAVILVDTKTLQSINEKLFPLFGFSNSLGVLCAEAAANKGSFVNYYFRIFSRERNWRQVERIHGFVMNQKQFYDVDAKPYANVGILFLYSEGMRSHFETYFGCAQALAESHIPFEVVFDGDGLFLNASLTLEDIIDFPVLIIPSLLQVTEEQKTVVRTYVEQGGIALVFDAESIGFPGINGEMSYGQGLFYFFAEDIAKTYYQNYNLNDLEGFSTIVSRYADSILSVASNPRRVVITPYLDESEEKLMMHVVNYDHIGFFDFLWPQSNIEVRIKQPGFSFDSLTLYSLDGSSKTIPFKLQDGEIVFTIPYLKDYVVVVVN